MKAGYIMAILVALILVVGCKPAVEEVPEEIVAEEPVVEEVVVEEPVVAPDTDIVQQKEDLSFEAADETAQRLIDACKAGNAGLSAALKSKYGIDMMPGGEIVAEEEPAME